MISSIYLDSTQLDTGGVYCQKISAPYPDLSFSAAVRGGYSGRKMSLPRYISQRIVTEWMIIAGGYSELATARDSFLKLMGSIISNEGATLKINKSNSIGVQIEVKSAKVSGDISPENVGWCKFMVEFETEYPFFTSQTEHTTEVNIFQGGGWAMPFAIPFDMSAGGSNAEIINHVGNIDAYPILRFAGPLINPTLINYTTNKVLNLSYTLTSASDVIEIDTYNRTAFYYAGNASPANVRAYVNGDFITLKAGNNDIRLGSSSYNAIAKCDVVFRDHYLNI